LHRGPGGGLDLLVLLDQAKRMVKKDASCNLQESRSDTLEVPGIIGKIASPKYRDCALSLAMTNARPARERCVVPG
jgi:hypothetical protein